MAPRSVLFVGCLASLAVFSNIIHPPKIPLPSDSQEVLVSREVAAEEGSKVIASWDRINAAQDGAAFKTWLQKRLVTAEEFNALSVLDRSALRGQFDQDATSTSTIPGKTALRKREEGEEDAFQRATEGDTSNKAAEEEEEEEGMAKERDDKKREASKRRVAQDKAKKYAEEAASQKQVEEASRKAAESAAFQKKVAEKIAAKAVTAQEEAQEQTPDKPNDNASEEIGAARKEAEKREAWKQRVAEDKAKAVEGAALTEEEANAADKREAWKKRVAEEKATEWMIMHNKTVAGYPITSPTHADEFTEWLDKDAVFEEDSFCLTWDINSDQWWTHNPLWEMGPENATHYCFQKNQNARKANILQALYSIQFESNCSNVYTKRMWQSGWGADMGNVVDGMKHAVKNQRPVAVVEKKWHYAAPKQTGPKHNRVSHPSACPRGNLFCYFLPLTKCTGAPKGDPAQHLENHGNDMEFHWYYEYITRRQTWLRRAIYDFVQKQTIQAPCSAMHVRRSDVVLHGGVSRKYHSIAEYVNATTNLRPNVFLLTDDANAIGEAKAEFPHLNWMFIDRPRYKASEGGWEQQIPSGDAALEVVVILGTFELIKRCDQLIHSKSGFSDQLYREMVSKGKAVDRIDLDQGKKRKAFQSVDNKQTVSVSKAYA